MKEQAAFVLEVARLWQEILRVRREDLFEGILDLAIDRSHGYDRLPQPGYVGLNYRRGGLLLVAQNPANDSAARGLSLTDQTQYALLEVLRDALSEEEIDKAFQALMAALAATDTMPSWKIVRNCVGPLLSRLDLSFTEVAYINLVKYRTAGTSVPSALDDRSWAHVAQQVSVLQPNFILAIGEGVRKKFATRYKRNGGSLGVLGVRRSRGDNSLPKTFEIDVQAIQAAFRERSA
jgi:hypothetical protein